MKRMIMVLLMVLFMFCTPTVTVEAASEVTVAASVIDTDDILPSLGIGLLAGGGTCGIAILLHKRTTKTLILKGETLKWDKDTVKIVDTSYIKTYETVQKDFYKQKTSDGGKK